MTGADFRRIALNMPGAVESAHCGHPDFRVGDRIFATLPPDENGYGVLLLTPEEQAGMVSDAPTVFSPVPGGWGRNGSTRVDLKNVTPDLLDGALRVAWNLRVEKNRARKPGGRAKRAAM